MRTETGLLAVLFVMGASAVDASPVKVTHDIRSDGPSQVIAEGVLRASPEKIWSQIIRFNDYATFMPHVLESFFITEKGVEGLKNAGTRNANKLRAVAKKYKVAVPRREGQKWGGLVFMVLNTPFPVENRWYVIRTVQDETKAAEHKYKRCWELVTGNIESAQGCWTFVPGVNPEETVSRYDDQADPGGNVPEWVTRMGATQTIPQMFEKVEKLAQSMD
ncbi:MAG TPA: SRPBCC family protein [bacterium]|nr:SRPBCC family protein [bacterium]